jgi:hypothetical protein
MAGMKFKAWSYSRWRDYDKCPAMANYKYNLKMTEPENDAMRRGNMVHKGAEDYIRGVTKKIIPELKLYTEELKWLRKFGASVEDQWTFTATWGETGWFDKDAWCRVKQDVWLRLDDDSLLTKDWKTGKPRGSYEDQMSLYGLSGLLKFPDVEVVETELSFVDYGPEHDVKETYVREQLPALKKEWASKTKALLSDTSYRPKPGDHCRWCIYSRSKNGPCKY